MLHRVGIPGYESANGHLVCENHGRVSYTEWNFREVILVYWTVNYTLRRWTDVFLCLLRTLTFTFGFTGVLFLLNESKPQNRGPKCIRHSLKYTIECSVSDLCIKSQDRRHECTKDIHDQRNYLPRFCHIFLHVQQYTPSPRHLMYSYILCTCMQVSWHFF